MILVTGATGNVGSALVGLLADAGEGARGVVRDPSRAGLREGVEWVAGDLNDASSLAGSLDGVDAAFLMSGYGGLADLLPMLPAAGVRRVVLLSALGASTGDRDNKMAAYHLEAEELVRDSGMPWTFLRPSTFMTNTLDWADQLRQGDVVRGPFADVAVATNDPLDIAAVAAVALHGGLDGQVLSLSGPEALRPADRVAVLGEVLGRDLRFEGLSDADARAELESTMGPYADATWAFFGLGELDESVVRPTVEQVTGRPARTYRQWVEDHQGAFRD